jgi:DNA-binding LacI/PurR family transcriptional regulator
LTVPSSSAGLHGTGGYDCARKLDIEGKISTAIACGSDAIAIGVIHYLSERGIRVPEDVSIIGIGDIPHSKFMVPPLTTLHVPRYEMGVRAVEMITRPEEPMREKRSCLPLP